MKKIDLHIHTKGEQDFDFSLDKLKEYVKTLEIDCIAITNHNLFDLEQFKTISEALEICTLPGIEIKLKKGHLLLISENTKLEDFKKKCDQINPKESIPTNQLKKTFSDLNQYLLIPHYDKDPSIAPEIIEKLKEFIFTGEVSSPKKFQYKIKDPKGLVPVLFSDLRFSKNMTQFSPRQTFIDIDEVSLKSIKMCLLDKNKVFLSKDRGHNFFQVLGSGLVLSTGLNIILGERSSGKTHTLEKISESSENIKYIKQFELVERDEKKDIQKFDSLLRAKESSTSESFLKEFKLVVEDVVQIDKKDDENKIEKYVDSLLKFVSEKEINDIFSDAAIFNENKYSGSNNKTLKKLIESVEVLFENTEYRDIIDSHITKDILLNLIIDLILKYNEIEELNLKKEWINSLIDNVKSELRSNTGRFSIDDIDFYNIMIRKEKLKKFNIIGGLVKKEKNIEKKEISRFQIIANTKKYSGAWELLKKSGIKISFSNAFKSYNNPVDFLDSLKSIESLPKSDYYKYFVNIEYKILNESRVEVSGGERSEFNLLQKIEDAYKYDLLLIDEPESSFDNLFLKNEVNKTIKEISKSIPVVIVTHNNTIGASINPNYVLYTKKEIIDKKAVFKIFSGNPTDKKLKSLDGETINNYDIMLNCLEAGDATYNKRRKTYEILKN